MRIISSFLWVDFSDFACNGTADASNTAGELLHSLELNLVPSLNR